VDFNKNVSKSELVHPRLLLVSIMLSSIVFALLLTALSFEFFVEDMAKVFVIPILVGAMFTSAAVIVTSFRTTT
jgi:hypothetical protein